mgnify:CR=1 FL=1
MEQAAALPSVNFDIPRDQYKHWKLTIDGHVATLAMDVREDAGMRPHDYKLKLNSYDLGVDIELADALNRIRFEHPEVKSVVITSGKSRMFCSGANIYMLGTSSHAWKVNFCKFTNETRNGIEDASQHSGLKFLAALNGTTAGGGYELALACDEIAMIDDRSSTVSLPEVPLLGVLAGAGELANGEDPAALRLAVESTGVEAGARGRGDSAAGRIDPHDDAAHAGVGGHPIDYFGATMRMPGDEMELLASLRAGTPASRRGCIRRRLKRHVKDGRARPRPRVRARSDAPYTGLRCSGGGGPATASEPPRHAGDA